jgi:hypothetical protein
VARSGFHRACFVCVCGGGGVQASTVASALHLPLVRPVRSVDSRMLPFQTPPRVLPAPLVATQTPLARRRALGLAHPPRVPHAGLGSQRLWALCALSGSTATPSTPRGAPLALQAPLPTSRGQTLVHARCVHLVGSAQGPGPARVRGVRRGSSLQSLAPPAALPSL